MSNILESPYIDRLYRIEEDVPEAEAYLYVYETGNCIYDYLQDDIEKCKEFVLEEFGVPYYLWFVSNKAEN